jgi:hypothetical protein
MGDALDVPVQRAMLVPAPQRSAVLAEGSTVDERVLPIGGAAPPSPLGYSASPRDDRQRLTGDRISSSSSPRRSSAQARFGGSRSAAARPRLCGGRNRRARRDGGGLGVVIPVLFRAAGASAGRRRRGRPTVDDQVARFPRGHAASASRRHRQVAGGMAIVVAMTCCSRSSAAPFSPTAGRPDDRLHVLCWAPRALT